MILQEDPSVDLDTPTGSMRTYVYRPVAPGRYPGLVLFSEIFQQTGPIKRTAAILAGLAVSHWFLDFITHRPDMPVLPWSDLKLGLGMWNSVPLTVLVEGLMYAGAVGFYARGRKMSRSFWILVAVLGVTYVTNVVGPPPPGVTPVALSMIALVPLVWWWGNKAGVAPATAS